MRAGVHAVTVVVTSTAPGVSVPVLPPPFPPPGRAGVAAGEAALAGAMNSVFGVDHDGGRLRGGCDVAQGCRSPFVHWQVGGRGCQCGVKS